MCCSTVYSVIFQLKKNLIIYIFSAIHICDRIRETKNSFLLLSYLLRLAKMLPCNSKPDASSMSKTLFFISISVFMRK